LPQFDTSGRATGATDIVLERIDGEEQVRLTDTKASESNPVLSPDGTKIVFVSDADGDAEIFVMDVDGTNAAPVTSNDVEDRQPSWSPDGAMVHYASHRNGAWEEHSVSLSKEPSEPQEGDSK